MKAKRRTKRQSKIAVPTKYVLLFLTFLSVVVMFISFTMNLTGGPLSEIAGNVIIPMQRGINTAGRWFSGRADTLKSLQSVMSENEELKAQVDQLTTELNTIQLEKYELDNLRTLFELDKKYPSYKKVGARVSGKDAGNWFDIFTIDKGSKHGIEKDMNVIAGSGLVGIVISVTTNSSVVRTIIDDSTNISASALTNKERFIVSGNLMTMTENQVIEFENLKNPDDAIQSGEQVVTSHISDLYLPGILIGQIQTIEKESNNLLCSGTIAPAVDFEHLEEVLIILEKKTQTKK